MHSVNSIDFTKIVLTSPVTFANGKQTATPFSERSNHVRFVSILYPTRKAQFTFTATIVEVGALKAQFGDDSDYCKMKPYGKDLTNLEHLENLPNIQPYKDNIGFNNEHYTQNRTLSDNYELKIKLRKSEGKYKFETSMKNIATMCEGQKVEITVSPGYYFNEVDKKYGVFYVLVKIDEIKKK